MPMGIESSPRFAEASHFVCEENVCHAFKCCWTPCSIQGAEITHPRQPLHVHCRRMDSLWEAIASFIRRALDYLFPSSAT